MKNYKNLDTEKLDYVIYCRKSSEGEDRQVQSIETQLRELGDCAKKHGLNVVEIIQESKSAFTAGRPGFARLNDLIKSKKANALLVVRANRISRNPIDAGQIVSLMDEKKLLYIRTPNSTCYTSSSTDKMMLGFELIFSKKDSDDKGDSVKEGQTTKAIKGVPHGVASLGFINDKTEEKGNRKWLVDKERLEKVRILLNMFLTGEWSARKLYKYAVDELKLTTVKRKKIGGKLIQPSRIYEILKDPMYAGFFFYDGERYELDKNLPRLITEDEHKKIKMILGKRHIPKVQKHEATFSGFVISPDNEFVGLDKKYQVICDCKKKFAHRGKTHCPQCNTPIDEMEKPKYLDYSYYYNNSKKKSGLEYKSVTDQKLTNYVVSEIGDKLTFSPELANWCRRHIKEMRDEEINQNLFKEEIAQQEAGDYASKKKRLREMIADKIINEEEYRADLAELETRYKPKEKTVSFDWTIRANEIVNLAEEFNKVMTDGQINAKRSILTKLGSNLVWNDENISIINKISVQALVNGWNELKTINEKFEPELYEASQGLNEKTSEFSPVFSTMLRE